MEIVKTHVAFPANLDTFDERICLVDGFLALDIYSLEKYLIWSRDGIKFNDNIASKLSAKNKCIIKVLPLNRTEYSLNEKREIASRAKIAIKKKYGAR